MKIIKKVFEAELPTTKKTPVPLSAQMLRYASSPRFSNITATIGARLETSLPHKNCL